MKEEKLDWFPIYWQRFIIGTLEMSAEEIGAYFLLLLHQWDKGFVPEDPYEIKKIARVSCKKLDKVLEKFKKNENIPNKIFNESLEIIRMEQLEKTAKHSNRGSKGAKARWDKHNESIAQEMLEHNLSNGIREEENRKEEIRIDIEVKTPKPKKVFISPSLLEFQEYFQENGFKKDVAERAWKGYDVADWFDSQGKKVKNWKQKCQNVWFKDENKANRQMQAPVLAGNMFDKVSKGDKY